MADVSRMGLKIVSFKIQDLLIKSTKVLRDEMRDTITSEKHMRKMKKMERKLGDKMTLLDQKLMMLEKQMKQRKYNLLFYRISQEPDERLYEKMHHFL